MRITSVILLGSFTLSLLGCGASKGTQKGTDDQLKALSTTVGNTGKSLPAGANDKIEKGAPKSGGSGGAAPGKGATPPPPPG